jgi:hypothetical protein
LVLIAIRNKPKDTKQTNISAAEWKRRWYAVRVKYKKIKNKIKRIISNIVSFLILNGFILKP